MTGEVEEELEKEEEGGKRRATRNWRRRRCDIRKRRTRIRMGERKEHWFTETATYPPSPYMEHRYCGNCNGNNIGNNHWVRIYNSSRLDTTLINEFFKQSHKF